MKRLSLLSVVLFSSLYGMEEASSSSTIVFPLDVWQNVINIFIKDPDFSDKKKMTNEEYFLREFKPEIKDISLCCLSVTSKPLNKLISASAYKRGYDRFWKDKVAAFRLLISESENECAEDANKSLIEKSVETKWIHKLDAWHCVPGDIYLGLKACLYADSLSQEARKKLVQIFLPKMVNMRLTGEDCNSIPFISSILTQNKLCISYDPMPYESPFRISHAEK